MNETSFNLDHFYSSFPQNYFDSLKQLTKVCKNVRHIHTDNGYNSIEGVYIRTKDGHYMEFLNRLSSSENKKVNFIAVNTFLSPIKDETTLQSFLKEKINLKKTQKPSKVPNNGSFQLEDIGKDWFFVWYVDSKIEFEENTSIWIMDYQDKKFNRVLTSKNQKLDLDFKQVLDVKWSLNNKEFEIMKTEGRWSAINYKSTDKVLYLLFNNPNGKEVKFEFIKNDERKSGFESIILEKIDKKSEFNLQDSSFIEMIDDKTNVTMKFNEY